MRVAILLTIYIGGIVDAFGASQPNICKHPQVLHDGGLIGHRREGKSIYYGTAEPVIFKICERVCRSAGLAEPRKDSP